MHSDVQQTPRVLTVQTHPSPMNHRGGCTAASSEALWTRCHLRTLPQGLSACVTGDTEPHRPHAGHRRAGMVSKTGPAGSFYPTPPVKHQNYGGAAWAHLRASQRKHLCMQNLPCTNFLNSWLLKNQTLVRSKILKNTR